MTHGSSTPLQPHPTTWGGRQFARVVEQADVPLCMVEVELQRCGAHVTRLLAAEFLAGPVADGATFRLLGRLYDGLIVPHAASFDVHDIAQAAGVPVVFDDDGASALNA